MSWRLLVASAVGAALLVFAQMPTRAQDGGAMIRGQIVATDTGQPLRRALITVSPELGGQRRTAMPAIGCGTAAANDSRASRAPRAAAARTRSTSATASASEIFRAHGLLR